MNSITLTFPLLKFQFPITIKLRQKLLFYPDTRLTTSAKNCHPTGTVTFTTNHCPTKPDTTLSQNFHLFGT